LRLTAALGYHRGPVDGRLTLPRRNLLVSSLVSGLAAGLAAALPGKEPELETLSDWLRARGSARQAGVEACLERIRASDGAIHAWVQVAPQPFTGGGKLAGIPFGAKDNMETLGLATEYGSPVYQGRTGSQDAAIVRDLRSRGAVLLGKTHMAAFAYRDPAPTRNPRNLEHTPGGSSSGSAAAVAAGMVPLALGTQTFGSVLRPASYCGVTGFKPSYGWFSVEGVLPLAPSLDTLGFFTNTPGDMLQLWHALDRPVGREKEVALGALDPLPELEPEMTAAFQNALSVLRRARVTVRPIDISVMLARLAEAANTVQLYEAARVHRERLQQYGDRLGQLAALVREGLEMPVSRYDDARQLIAQSRARVLELYRATPVILVPAATGPAPLGLASTGDARMNSPWTALGTPAISLPMPVGGGLPLGLQLTAAPGQDARVLRTAVRIGRILDRA
jgi:Asp-tRNA(Asn)/Glu-tRNA(Gln) amidotransferase A subunit family amidase